MKIKTTVKQDFNDIKNNYKKRSIGEELILDEERYNELYMKGKVNEGKAIKEKKQEKNEEVSTEE